MSTFIPRQPFRIIHLFRFPYKGLRIPRAHLKMRLYGNFLLRRRCIFFLVAQPLESSREIAFIYDETVSGASVYNYYRDYSPEIGRYIESDPIGLRGGTNTFAYVRSSPLLYLDPSGLDPNLTSLARQIAKCLCSIDPFYCTNLNSIGSGIAGLRDLFGIPTAGSTSVFGDITISQNLYGGTPNLPIPVTPPSSPPATATSPDVLELAETVAHEINHQKLDSPIRRMFTENPQAAANAQAFMSPANRQKILNCLNCTNTQ